MGLYMPTGQMACVCFFSAGQLSLTFYFFFIISLLNTKKGRNEEMKTQIVKITRTLCRRHVLIQPGFQVLILVDTLTRRGTQVRDWCCPQGSRWDVRRRPRVPQASSRLLQHRIQTLSVPQILKVPTGSVYFLGFVHLRHYSTTHASTSTAK